MIERHVEEHLGKIVKDHGGQYYKWVSPGNSGVPDRIVLLAGQVWFVELKKPGEKPRPLQRRTLFKLNSAGYNTAVVDSIEEGDMLVARILQKGGDGGGANLSAT